MFYYRKQRDRNTSSKFAQKKKKITLKFIFILRIQWEKATFHVEFDFIVQLNFQKKKKNA